MNVLRAQGVTLSWLDIAFLETSLPSDKSLGYDRMSLRDNSPGGAAETLF